jgi:hypothetical protein
VAVAGAVVGVEINVGDAVGVALRAGVLVSVGDAVPTSETRNGPAAAVSAPTLPTINSSVIERTIPGTSGIGPRVAPY